MIDVKSVATNLSGFLEKHSGELRLLASVVGSVVAHLPIDQQDKARMTEALDSLQKSAGNIAAGAAALAEAANTVAGDHAQGPEVVIDKADLQEAVREEIEREHNAGE